MFINICWKQSNGEVKKALQPINKASKLIQEMENQGDKTWIELEQTA